MSDLTEQARRLYKMVDDFPEQRGDGWIRLIELRNIVPQLLDEIDRLERLVRDGGGRR